MQKENPSKSLANRLREVYTEGKWVTGTNVKEQIMNTSWQDAVKSIHGLNSIAALTFHLHYYIAGVTQVLEGGTLDIKDKYSFDAPPITSEQDWKDRIDLYNNSIMKFISLVENMSEAQLFENFVLEKYGTYHRNIDVQIEHAYYHLGQILLIKKMIGNSES
ncbi:DUF1572 family protein [Kordia sp.]|uniref:DUF1572 family protein n=1 Tax=Kordia sp. TaxID=1965332 RepID=UPI0025BCFF1E|nr:DUF1572 family protein [Kordia sp.]MCH2196362.1 DUF1572 family protein [Kordia sp.]